MTNRARRSTPIVKLQIRYVEIYYVWANLCCLTIETNILHKRDD